MNSMRLEGDGSFRTSDTEVGSLMKHTNPKKWKEIKKKARKNLTVLVPDATIREELKDALGL